MPVLRNLLSYLGIRPERLRLDWVSAAESTRFAQVVTEFTEEIRALGPSELRKEVPA
jgi:F420-non-reducing hydrogenase iron-sulfur subunit